MNPIKKIKLAEKKAGKPNPVFDGVIEPDFPDEKENNKMLDGVDANHDGVRDDIEIWINRTTEDQYVRWAMKDNYKKNIEAYKTIELNSAELEVHKGMAEYSDSSYCLLFMLKPYKEKYIKVFHQAPEDFYGKRLGDLIVNSSYRSSIQSKWNSYQIKGVVGSDSEQYCLSLKIKDRYKEILDKEIKKNSKR